MATVRRHMSANIEGMLRNYKGRSMNGLITDENGCPGHPITE